MDNRDPRDIILDRMLDDLKTTVGSEAEINSPDVRSDSTLVSSFRSTSRNEGRIPSRSGSRAGSSLGGVEDGGHMRHTRKEYRSPDDNTHVVTEKYEYDTGDSSKSKHYQKKVIKSTYSNFDSMSAGSLEDPPHLNDPIPQQTKPVNTKVISASQKVANRLVDALATIGGEEGYVPTADSSDTDTLATDTMKTTRTVGSDYSTLGRLRKNINELDTMIDSMDKSQQQETDISSSVQVVNYDPPEPVEVLNSAPPEPVEVDVPLILEASELPPDDEDEMQIQEVQPSVALTIAAAEMHSQSVSSSTHISSSQTSATVQQQVVSSERSTAPNTTLTNGSIRSTHSSKYDGDDEMIDDSKSGEVRRIVWRNRFEKTYETQDSSKPPVMSIEEEARRRQTLQRQQQMTSTSSTSTLSSPPGPSSPPQVSPSGQSWKEPIPLPTPPQLSPREPGVAYIYTYGNQGGQGVQPLPPLNYVSVPGPASVPPSEGAPSPTPSQVQGQPIIYHYSYHYTIQPGQPLPDGAPPPPGGLPSGSPPALQVAPSSQPAPQTSQPVTVQLTQSNQPGHPDHPAQPGQSSVNYSIHKHTSSHTSSSTVNRSNTTNIINSSEHPGDKDPYGPGSPPGNAPGTPRGTRCNHEPGTRHDPTCHGVCPGCSRDPGFPHEPGCTLIPGSPYGSIGPKRPDINGPKDPGHPGNISITINKTTTRTTHNGYPGEPHGPHSPSDAPPVTSTPYPSRGRSVSPERTPSSNAPNHITYLTHISSNDSLGRVRRPRNDTLPFPDTSPIKGTGDGKIPRRVDDLMTSFSDSEDGPGQGPPYNRGPKRDPADEEPLLPYNNNQIAVKADADAKAAAEATAKRDLTKNKAGPPVYYPPGHELFHETMHTMTLKESGRRGKAKWRMERSAGYKESSSSSETKGGMTMVPVCLPLCCGAACVVM